MFLLLVINPSIDSSKYPPKKDITPPIGARLFLTSLYSKLTSLILLLLLQLDNKVNKIPNLRNKKIYSYLTLNVF